MKVPSSHSAWSRAVSKVQRLQVVFTKFWWIVLLALAIGGCLGAWNAANQKAVYVSTGRMMVSGKISLHESSSYSEELNNFYGTQIALMQSGEVRRRAIARLQATNPEIEPAEITLEVNQLPHASIFVLTATGPSREYSQKILDACMDEYIRTKQEMRSQTSETTQTAIVDQLGRIEKEWRAGEDQLIEFQKKHNVASLQEQANSAGSYLGSLNLQLADLKKESHLLDSMNLDQMLDHRTKSMDSSNGAASAAGADQNQIAGLTPESEYLKAKQQIQLLKAQRDDFSKVLRPKHPTIIELDQKISEQQSLVESFRAASVEQLKTRRQSIQLQIDNLQVSIKEWEAKALEYSALSADYNRIKSKVDRAKTVYDNLQTDMHNIGVTRSVDQDIVSILERASTATPVRSGTLRLLLMGLFGGLAAGIGILLILDQADDRITSFSEFQSKFHEHSIGQIPKQKPVNGLVEHLQPNDVRHSFAEALRAVRSSIFFLPVEGVPPKVFLITSGAPNEGKSTVSVNLSITMAFSGAKVLLIDADFRRGCLHDEFGLTNEKGISDVLARKTSIDEIIQATPVENLSLMSRGKSVAHPGELFLGKQMDLFLKEIYSRFDYIIFDSCPVLAADDTTSLAPKIDATIFVVRFASSSSRNSRKALDLLKERQANVIGVICNDVDERVQDYYYYKYPEYYSNQQNA